MPLVSVPAVYDGEHVRLLEQPPVSGPYRVLVTFIEPVNGVSAEASNLAQFWTSFGAWQDDDPAEATVRKLRDARRSKSTPPPL